MRLRLTRSGGRWEAGKDIIPLRTVWLTDGGGGLAYGAEPGGREVSGGWYGSVVKGDRAKTERGDGVEETEGATGEGRPTFQHGDTAVYEQTGVVGVCSGDDKESCLRHRVSTGQEDAC